MKQETLELLQDPCSGNPLILKSTAQEESVLANTKSGTIYPIQHGMPNFLTGREISGTNRTYQLMYNRLSPFYDFVTRTAITLMHASEESVRLEYLRELEIRPGDKVLEVSVGTGTNFCYLPRNAHYYGLDLSPGQLRQCRKKLKKLGLEAELFLGEGEKLPFKDHVFDVVFHMGGINFFTDPAAAVQEMFRVAKPGSKLVIVDETDRFTKKLAKIPVVKSFFKHTKHINVPDLFVPEDAEDVQVKELFGGRLWFLSFRKAKAQTRPATIPTYDCQR